MSGYEFQHWADIVSKFGFSLIAIIGLGFFVWHIWKWITKKVNNYNSNVWLTFKQVNKAGGMVNKGEHGT